jgi:hypothetical protein
MVLIRVNIAPGRGRYDKTVSGKLREWGRKRGLRFQRPRADSGAACPVALGGFAMAFDEAMVQAVWETARAVLDRDGAVWRKDACGAWLRREHYGNQTSEYGWKIELTAPGTPDDVTRLGPFHRKNSFDPNTGEARCQVTADRDAIQPTAHIDTPHNRSL